MLAELNVFILVVWLIAELIPCLANHLAKLEVEMDREDRKD
jgi:hypothetical protein